MVITTKSFPSNPMGPVPGHSNGKPEGHLEDTYARLLLCVTTPAVPISRRMSLIDSAGTCSITRAMCVKKGVIPVQSSRRSFQLSYDNFLNQKRKLQSSPPHSSMHYMTAVCIFLISRGVSDLKHEKGSYYFVRTLQ